MKIISFLIITFIALVLSMPAFSQTPAPILPHRVIDTRTMTVVDFEGLLHRLSEADIVTLGENHDDPATHLVELAVLKGIYRYRGDVVLSMEMFERDVQPILDSYLAGEISETEFLENSRPWPAYETDYRPMVEFMRDAGLPVIAANCPRPMASRVSQEGYENIEWLPEERQWIAVTFDASQDAYWELFRDAMSGPASHGDGGMPMSEEMIASFFEAQVLKDETMAESVTRAHENFDGSLVYHVTGNFHTGDWLGTFSRIKRNLPASDALSVIVAPVENLLDGIPEGTSGADYIILVLAPENVEEEPVMEMPEEILNEGEFTESL